MSLAHFWTATDAAQCEAAHAIRADRRFELVHRHAIVLESWRQNLLESRMATGLPFWYEAQNDYLLAMVHAGRGIWRSSLQALRSFVENAAGAVYYSEHPVEARRFKKGEFRLSWTNTKQYFAEYPDDVPVTFRRSLWQDLTSEYSDLSEAVHGSSEAFRMTAAQQFPALCSSEAEKIGAWRTHAVRCAKSIHLLLMAHFATELAGARLRGLREDLATVLSVRDRSRVQQKLHIVIPRP